MSSAGYADVDPWFTHCTLVVEAIAIAWGWDTGHLAIRSLCVQLPLNL